MQGRYVLESHKRSCKSLLSKLIGVMPSNMQNNKLNHVILVHVLRPVALPMPQVHILIELL